MRKTVLPMAVLGVLAAGPAFAAGETGAQQGAEAPGLEQTQAQEQPGMEQQQTGAAGAEQAFSQDLLREVQSQLQEQGYEVGQVDGIWGDQTRQALMQFQQDKGLQSSGQIDLQTIAELGVMDDVQRAQVPGETPGDAPGAIPSPGAAPTSPGGMDTGTGAAPGGDLAPGGGEQSPSAPGGTPGDAGGGTGGSQ